MGKKPDLEDLLPDIEAAPPDEGCRHADAEHLLQVLRGWGARVVFGEYARMGEADWHELREISRAVGQFAGELAQARKGQGRGPRRRWSPDRVQGAIDGGIPLRAAARQESLRTGEKLSTIERAMHERRSNARARRK